MEKHCDRCMNIGTCKRFSEQFQAIAKVSPELSFMDVLLAAGCGAIICDDYRAEARQARQAQGA